MKEQLRQIVNKPAAELTAEDVAFIKKAVKATGTRMPRKQSCNSCWIDCAVKCFITLKTRDRMNSRLRDGVDILFNGERVCEATATEGRMQRWIKAGLPMCYVRND